MMIDVKNITDISLSQNEYGYLVTDQYYNNSSFKLKIPKLMPNITGNRNEPFNKNILINDSKCKPSINNTIRTQNYITIKRSPQCSLYHKRNNDEEELVLNNTRVTCLCMNNNYRDMVIIDSI